MRDGPVRVLVVGGGNAALCAAISAAEAGAAVQVLEAAPSSERGGNSSFTAGAFKVAYDSVDDLTPLMDGITDRELNESDFGHHTEREFYEDLCRTTRYRTDPNLSDIVAAESLSAVTWLRDHGVKFLPMYGQTAYKVDGKFRFWGGLPIAVNGGGAELVETLYRSAEAAGVDIIYEMRARKLLMEGRSTVGVVAKGAQSDVEFRADAIILACGGFEANPELRARYLGPSWDLAKVRGTRHNMGEGLSMALDVGAMPYGHWSGCHAVAQDLNAPDEGGDYVVRDGYQKHGYPLGIVVNADGKRFLDEGADFFTHTYSRYGRAILEQPGGFAWQVFDSQVAHLTRGEYKTREVTRVSADTLESLARQMDGVDAYQFMSTVRDYNRSVDDRSPFEPNRLDGRRTRGITPPKSNWANRIDQPPFVAYGVTCGITFTYGGLRITETGQVVGTDRRVLPNLFACGEIVGGLYYHNYAAGSGLTSGTVFGLRAGNSASALDNLIDGETRV